MKIVLIGQALRMAPDQLAREHRADGAVDVSHVLDDLHLLAALERRRALLDQPDVERLGEAVVLRLDVPAWRPPGGAVGAWSRRLKSRPRAFQWAMPFRVSSRSTRPISSSNVRTPSCGHDRARLLGDEEEVVDDVLGAAGEFRAQHRVLRRHPHRAGVEVALAHHDAALGDERRGREAELVGAEQRADDDVAAGLHLAVGLDADAAAQAIEHQRLLRFGEAELPRRSGVLDRAPRRCAGAAVVAGDDDVVGLRLGDAGGDRADADLGDELDADARLLVRVLQVVDQLRQILDRVDVVVRRRRDQADAGHRVAQPADVLADLAARQLPAFAGLGALRHLDLQLVGRDEVLGRHAEPARRDLLDLRAQRVARLEREVDDDVALADDVAEVRAFGDRLAAQFGAVARRVLAALAGVRLAADPVHRDRERRVRLGRDRAERHRAGREALDDLGRRLDLVDRDRLRRVDDELEQAAQRHVALGLVVDEAREFLVRLVAVRAHAVLQLGDRVGRPHVLFAAHAPGVLAAGVEHSGEHRVVAERGAVHADRLLGDAEDVDAADLARRAAEVLLDQRLLETDRLEQLRAAVRHVRRHAHLRHDLRQALADRLDVVGDRLVRAEVRRQLLLQRAERLEREVGMDRLGAVAGEHREVMHLARRAGLDDEAGGRAQPLANQVLVHGREREQRRHGDVLAVHARGRSRSGCCGRS